MKVLLLIPLLLCTIFISCEIPMDSNQAYNDLPIRGIWHSTTYRENPYDSYSNYTIRIGPNDFIQRRLDTFKYDWVISSWAIDYELTDTFTGSIEIYPGLPDYYLTFDEYYKSFLYAKRVGQTLILSSAIIMHGTSTELNGTWSCTGMSYSPIPDTLQFTFNSTTQEFISHKVGVWGSSNTTDTSTYNISNDTLTLLIPNSGSIIDTYLYTIDNGKLYLKSISHIQTLFNSIQ